MKTLSRDVNKALQRAITILWGTIWPKSEFTMTMVDLFQTRQRRLIMISIYGPRPGTSWRKLARFQKSMCQHHATQYFFTRCFSNVTLPWITYSIFFAKITETENLSNAKIFYTESLSKESVDATTHSTARRKILHGTSRVGPYIDRHVERQSTEVSAVKSAKCRWSVGEVTTNHGWLSTDRL